MNTTLDRSHLVALGIGKDSVEAFANRIEEMFGRGDEAAFCWQELSAALVAADFPFPVHEYLFQVLQARHEPEEGPLPAWMPSLAVQNNSNIAAILKRTELTTYEDLHRWSAAEPASYWSMMAEVCGIVFRKPWDQTLDLSRGPRQPSWFTGARLNIAESCFQADPEQTAIVYRQHPDSPLERLSFAELDLLSNRVANGLQALGFQPGAAVAIDMAMTVEAVAIYLGLIKAGCVVISIADSFSASEIATRLRIGEAQAIFTVDAIERGGKRHPIYAKVIAANAPRAVVLLTGNEADTVLREGDLLWSQFLGEDTAVTVEQDPHETINILFSSGTTGDPKAIPWNHTTPLKCAADGYLHHDIKPGDVVCWPTNLGWMMGPWVIFASLINRAILALFYDAPNTRGFATFVQDAGVTMLGVVPSLVKNWRNTKALANLDWRTLKAFSSTGECANSSDMLYLMASAGYKPVIEYCGGTELGGAYLTSTLVQPNAPACFTTPALGCDLLILDDEDNLANEGEAFLIPPSIGMSTVLLNRDHDEVYYGDAPSGPKGIILRRHGDRIEKLTGGFYKAHGRADDTMNLGGIKVSSAEIERALKQLDMIDETAAVAVPPAGGGPSRLIIYAVVLQEIDTDTLTALMQKTIGDQLNPLFKIHATFILPALPRTASGKILRRELRRIYLAESQTTERPPSHGET